MNMQDEAGESLPASKEELVTADSYESVACTENGVE